MDTFSDGQLKQLRELLEPLYRRQDDLQALIIREASDLGDAVAHVGEKVDNVQADVKKLESVVVREASDLGEIVAHVGVRVDEAQKEVNELITEKVNPVIKDHDKRIGRIERHLDLAPLE